MSLRFRLTLAITALVVVTLFLAFRVGQDRVLRPFAGQVFAAFADQAAYAASRVEAGDDPAVLSAQLHLEIARIEGPPGEARPPRWRRGAGPPPDAAHAWERRGLRHVERGGRVLVFPQEARDAIYVQLDDGWLMVRRDLDLDRPRKVLVRWLPAIGLLVIGLAALLAAWSVRGLETARAAMERVADGDLSTRIPADGPPELARMAEAFNRMTARVAGLLRTEQELLAGVSHELRTPLARMRLSLEMLRDDGASERRVNALEADVAELDALIGELVGWSRLQLGEAVIHPEPTDLGAFVREVVSRLAPGVAVIGEGEAQLDRRLAERALTNLLANAAKHGGGATEVRVQGSSFTVLDAGPGVAPADLPRLFEPFFRADRSRSKASGGLGLGLLIVAQVARLHGGEASAAPGPAGGLAVTVRFGPA